MSIKPSGFKIIEASELISTTNGLCPGAMSVDLEGTLRDTVFCHHLDMYLSAEVVDTFSGARCNVMVHVIDAQVPTAICNAGISVSLTTGISSFVPAAVFDGGSSDNCSIDSILVSRDGIIYMDGLYFSCSDINESPVLIWVKLIDIYGNENVCTSQATVQDQLIPSVNCPTGQSVLCTDDIFDLNLLGQATFDDNCAASTNYADIDLTNNCGLGVIERHWTATDQSGNSSVCIQYIQVIDTTGPSIVIPDDMTLNCTDSIHPSNTGYVKFVDDCGSFGASYDDQIFYTAPPSSYRIFRTWEGVNFCDDGYSFSYEQIITVEDHEAPELSCTGDVYLELVDNSCEAYVVLTASGQDNCDPTVDIQHNSIYADQQGADASGIYPLGTHEILFSVEDASGNLETCLVHVEIVDRTPPLASCLIGLSVNLNSNGQFQLDPTAVNGNSKDNCTENSALQLMVLPSFFSCLDMGINDITLTVTDEAGNASFCTTEIDIQDNQGNCPEVVEIGGLIFTEDGRSVGNVEVSLIADPVLLDTTQADGSFYFDNLNTGLTYKMRPEKNTSPNAGLSTLDILLLRRHLLDKVRFNSPYKYIAADANGSNSVSTIDIVVIRQVLLDKRPDFINVPSWRFVDSAFDFPNPENPFETHISEEIILTNLMSSRLANDFIAVKIGDLSLDANTQLRETKQLHWFVEETSEHNIIGLEAREEMKIQGLQMQFETSHCSCDELTIQSEALPDFGSGNYSLQPVFDGCQIAISWDYADDVLFGNNEIMFSIKQLLEDVYNGQPSLRLTSNRMKPEYYTENGQIGVGSLFLTRKPGPVIGELNVYPNPASKFLHIDFNSKWEKRYRMELISWTGRQEHTESMIMSKGLNERWWQIPEKIKNGIYLFRLSNGMETYEQKIIVLHR